LFICGGAFEGLEKVIEKRVRETTMGFRPSRKARFRKAPDALPYSARPHPTT
jgi:ATP-dependent protease Clp ATPase subunit